MFVIFDVEQTLYLPFGIVVQIFIPFGILILHPSGCQVATYP
nr:MAG TPA: NADH-ubiquinone/plastoquinone oxidoreductase, chain 3 [Caudoviricetes sp.]